MFTNIRSGNLKELTAVAEERCSKIAMIATLIPEFGASTVG
jgi:hypothetical protein